MWARGPGEIAQLAESSPCKHKELSSNPQHRLKNKQTKNQAWMSWRRVPETCWPAIPQYLESSRLLPSCIDKRMVGSTIM